MIPSDGAAGRWSHDGDHHVIVECRSAKSENGHECFVDSPKLLMGQMPDQLAQPPGVYGPDLLNENAGNIAFDLRFGSERCRSSASRCRGDDDYRSGEELVCLHHHGKAITMLFVPDAPR